MAGALALAIMMISGRPRAAPAEETARAKTQFEQGRAAVKSGDLSRARALFLSSESLVPKTATLMNLADCEERLGLYASALQHFQEAVLLAPPGDDRIEGLKRRARAVEPKVPRLRVQAKGPPVPGMKILIDAREVAAESLQAGRPMDPGQYVMLVTAPGRKEREYKVHLSEGETVVVEAEPGDLVPRPPALAKMPAPAAPAPAGGLGKLQVAGLALGGVGVVGLVVGAVTGAMAVSKKEQLDGMCPVANNCTKEGVDLAAEGSRFGTASTVGLTAGGIALALGAGAFAVRAGVPGGSAAIAVGPSQASVTFRWAF